MRCSGQAYGLSATEFLGNNEYNKYSKKYKRNSEKNNIKVGVFCESYGKDSYILSYLLRYEIKEVKYEIYKIEFSKKVITKLEEVDEK